MKYDIDTWPTFQRNMGYSAAFKARVQAKRKRQLSAQLLEIELDQAKKVLAARECPEEYVAIIEAICRKRVVSMLPLVTGNRAYEMVKARDEAIYSLRGRQSGKQRSLPRLGRYFGLDHTSVMASLARYSLRTGKPPLTQSSYYRRRVLKDLAA